MDDGTEVAESSTEVSNQDASKSNDVEVRRVLRDTLSGLMKVKDTIQTLNRIQGTVDTALETIATRERDFLARERELIDRVHSLETHLASLTSVLATMHKDQPVLQKLLENKRGG